LAEAGIAGFKGAGRRTAVKGEKVQVVALLRIFHQAVTAERKGERRSFLIERGYFRTGALSGANTAIEAGNAKITLLVDIQYPVSAQRRRYGRRREKSNGENGGRGCTERQAPALSTAELGRCARQSPIALLLSFQDAVAANGSRRR